MVESIKSWVPYVITRWKFSSKYIDGEWIYALQHDHNTTAIHSVHAGQLGAYALLYRKFDAFLKEQGMPPNIREELWDEIISYAKHT